MRGGVSWSAESNVSFTTHDAGIGISLIKRGRGIKISVFPFSADRLGMIASPPASKDVDTHTLGMSARRQEPGALFSRFPSSFPSFFARFPFLFVPYPFFPYPSFPYPFFLSTFFHSSSNSAGLTMEVGRLGALLLCSQLSCGL
jgi:hypothetical protein